MNKKVVAIIVTVVIVLVAVIAVVIGTADKPTYDETPNNTNEQNNVSGDTLAEDNVFVPNENVSDDNASNEASTPSTDNKNESVSNDKNEPSTNKTEPSTGSNDKDEPVTCQYCGNEIKKPYGSGQPDIGAYCDGYCQEWLG